MPGMQNELYTQGREKRNMATLTPQVKIKCSLEWGEFSYTTLTNSPYPGPCFILKWGIRMAMFFCCFFSSLSQAYYSFCILGMNVHALLHAVSCLLFYIKKYFIHLNLVWKNDSLSWLNLFPSSNFLWRYNLCIII